MALVLTASVTLDESSGLQTGLPATATEDNNDNDISLASLNSTFSARILALHTDPDTVIGVATNTVGTLTAGSTLTGFVADGGGALPAYAGAATSHTVTASFTAIDGSPIYLCIDTTGGSGLGDDVLLGVKADGTIVFAAHATVSGANVNISMIQFEALDNPNSSNPDDAVDLTGLVDLAVSSPVEFDLSTLPSGQNLFGAVGSTSAAIVVIGETIVLKADNTYDNGSNTINTSQGGGPTTIGVNNQAFDPGDGAYFTYVTGTPSGLVGTSLSQGEADDLDNAQFTGTISNVTSAFLNISQNVGNTTATLSLRAFDIDGTKDGDDFEAARGQNPVDIIQIKVTQNGVTSTFNADGTLNGITITNLTGVHTGTADAVTIAGLGAGAKVEWTTSVPHDQILVKGIAGKFDIGGFGLTQGQTDHLDVGDKIRFEDDGPTIAAGNAPTALTVDETNLGTDTSGDFSGLFLPAFGTDGEASSDSLTYALGITSTVSGLTDTATGNAVVLGIDSGDVVGTVVANGLTVEVFRISVDLNGTVSLDQKRAIVHPDTGNPDDVKSMAAGLITLSATATDGDGDQTTRPAGIGDRFQFRDDGPSIDNSATPAPEILVDDSNLNSPSDPVDFGTLFTFGFGADGPRDVNHDGVADAAAVVYALEVQAPDADSGLFDTLSGQKILLSLNGTGEVEGRTETSDLLVFTVTVNGTTGAATLTQDRAVKHNDADDPDEAATPAKLILNDLIKVTGTVTDGDGDTDQAVSSVGLTLIFKDDGPTIGGILDDSVAGTDGSSVTNPLGAHTGNDGGDVGITGFDPTIDFGTFVLNSDLSVDAKTLIYFLDADSSGDFTSGEEVYTLELNTGGADSTWSYTLTVNQTLGGKSVDFDFSELPSGQNLFGTIGTADGALVVIGQHPIVDGTGKYTNTSNTINTSKGGGGVTIGVTNQMFDPNEGAYFTYVTGTDPSLISTTLSSTEADIDSNIDFSGTLDVHSASLKVVQVQGSKSAPVSMELHAFSDDSIDGAGFVSGLASETVGAGNEVEITEVHVFSATGAEVFDGQNGLDIDLSPAKGAIVTGFKANYTIKWVTADEHNQVLVLDKSGKWDIGDFSIDEAQNLPDQLLDFTVGIIDGDGDGSGATKIDDSFSIGIDVNLDGQILIV